MPVKKPKELHIRTDQRWCKWCANVLSFRRFDKHVDACEQYYYECQSRPHKYLTRSSRSSQTPTVALEQTPANSTLVGTNNDIDMCDEMSAIEYESEEEDLTFTNPVQLETDGRSVPTSATPHSFLEIIHHPHSGKTTSTILSLDNPPESDPEHTSTFTPLRIDPKPWAPFRTQADFEFTEMVVREGFHAPVIKQLLEGFNGRWASGTSLSFKTYSDFQDSLAAARQFSVEFQEGETSHSFRGHSYQFKFRYRDPWKWLLEIITDPTLADSMIWYPVEKYLHHGGCITRIYDELNSGTLWWNIQETLPCETDLPSVYLPLHLWLDKSNVAKTVTKHPIVMRPGFLPSSIRNASGNGGGVLIGYMAIVKNSIGPDSSEDDSLDSVEYAQFKREVYHEICRTIFKSLQDKSSLGEAIVCGDGITRVVYPGFMIHAVDGEEAYSICGTRGVKANHPCVRCLAPRDELKFFTKSFELRTQQSMKAIYHKSLELATSHRQKLLRDYGLHLVKNAFWDIGNSDPYLALSYDILHAFDLGEWGKHQWPLIRNNLVQHQKDELNRSMEQVPPWSGLKRSIFPKVATMEFSDGNSHRDILKCILPCIVNLLPHDSPFVPAIRLCAIIRMIASLNYVTEEHIQYLQQCLVKYEKLCLHLSSEFDKNYNYPKHHSLVHLIEDLRAKGATVNYTTRPGEGFQQEVQQAWDQTNYKNTEMQMTRIDENQEAIARIRLSVNNYKKQVARAKEAQNQSVRDDLLITENHWSLGSSLPMTTAKTYEIDHAGQTGFRSFEKNLRGFLSDHIRLEEQPDEPLKIKPYQCLYLRYRSLEDWQEKKDILRCNPEFNNGTRYDFVLINTEPHTYGRLMALFSCYGPGEVRHDIALVRSLGRPSSSWRPKTRWDGCLVLEEKNEVDFYFIKYFVRGCHFIPAFGGPHKSYYLNDMIDADAFLRFYLLERLTQCSL